jgi:hypothetical protein
MGLPAIASAQARRAGHRTTTGYLTRAYLNGTSQATTLEDARLPARLRPVGDYTPEGRAYSSERRTSILFAVAAGDS